MTYRQLIEKTKNAQLTPTQTLTNAAMGLCGEAGEVSELIKKHLFHGKELDRDKVIKELGDVRWYIELLLLCIDSDMETVEAQNKTKLLERYQNGFSAAASEARVDLKPENVINQFYELYITGSNDIGILNNTTGAVEWLGYEGGWFKSTFTWTLEELLNEYGAKVISEWSEVVCP